nr:head-tail adaptor protein [Brevundimonas diminuta]
MVSARDLRDLVAFETRREDANGDPLGPFEPAFTTWAKLVWLRGSESAVQQRLEGRQPVAIVVRASPTTRDITPAWRAVMHHDTAQVFNITSVSPAKERGFIDILAVMGGATG